MPSTPPPNIRVIIRLPFNRPDSPHSDPCRVEWNQEKEKILWEVIARSRATDNGGTDWKGLAAHLDVPLPYLLYRAQTRYEEDLRGLQDIKGTPSPSNADNVSQPGRLSHRVTLMQRVSGTSRTLRSTSSIQISNPLDVLARLNSLSQHPTSPRLTKVSSSSVATLQGYKRQLYRLSHSSSEESSDAEDVDKSEEADRQLEEQQTLERKLKDLQKMMTGDRLGLVRSTRLNLKDKQVDRGRNVVAPESMYPSLDSSSRSQSASSINSPQGSIPSIPSPPPESRSPMRRHMSPGKSSSPPAISPGSAHGQPHIRYGGLVGMAAHGSDTTSNHGSSASSFSDISEGSLSTSALESALMSNNGRSRFSAFTRSNFGRGSRAIHQ